MDYQKVEAVGRDVALHGIRNFGLRDMLDCGQAFRWREAAPDVWEGVALERYLQLYMDGDRLVFRNASLEEFEALWRDYFDLNRDYSEVKALLASDRTMRAAAAHAPGMRVLRQDPWEALCSFIISQNNNIGRIRGIVERLCECFGESLEGGRRTFPSPERLADLSPEDLAPLRCGFRAGYILDAARLVAGRLVDLRALSTQPLGEARETLRRIRGVGPKVAECALLYGLGRTECVPVDVWIARAMEEWYPDGFPAAFAPVAGIAQQYLFHYIRTGPDRQVADRLGENPLRHGTGRCPKPRQRV